MDTTMEINEFVLAERRERIGKVNQMAAHLLALLLEQGMGIGMSLKQAELADPAARIEFYDVEGELCMFIEMFDTETHYLYTQAEGHLPVCVAATADVITLINAIQKYR